MKRRDLVTWLDKFLSISHFKDASLNGLQVQGREEVGKVSVAVDASLETFKRAADLGAELIVVHHGLFWGEQIPVVGIHRERLKVLLDNNISLYAAHIPLDAHREVGNNWGLARILGLEALEDFGLYRGMPIGVKGVFPGGIILRDLADRIETSLSEVTGRRESVLVHAGEPEEVIGTIGIISGAAAGEIVTASQEGLDAFLTGEPKHELFHEAFEREITALYAGHYMTETVGVSILAERLRSEFDLAVEFVLHPTGL
jgi:dinuclear metal center YbgI/SA1388 family protein